MDFTLATQTNLESAIVFVFGGGPVNGALDDFSGALGWAVYFNNAGVPGDLIASGVESAPQIRINSLSDLASLRIRLDTVPTLPASTYWLGLRVGAWGTEPDGTPLSWEVQFTEVGDDSCLGTNLAAAEFVLDECTGADFSLVVAPDLLFASGFETGAACAWVNSAASAICP